MEATTSTSDAHPAAGDERPPPRRRRWRRWALAALGAAIVLLVVAIAVGSWHFSSVLLIPSHEPGPYDVEVAAASPGSVTLPPSDDTRRPGTYGLDWDGGHAILGPVLGEDGDGVTRRVTAVEGNLERGTDVEIDPRVWQSDPLDARDIPFTRVRVNGQLGAMPAWRVDGRGDTWAIFVHGIDGTRQASLRILPALTRAGLSTLAITYRNDAGAPPAPDGKHHLGLTEWRDLDAAARYALSHGARRLVLVGYSMGGAIVTQFMERSPRADRVAALVLDAPALSWKPILEHNARDMGLPGQLAVPVQWAVGLRIDVDWNRLDVFQHLDALRLPILLFHGGEDTVVPFALSERLARELPRHVTFHPVPQAGHVESWNVAPTPYERRVRAFLRRVGVTVAGPRAAAR